MYDPPQPAAILSAEDRTILQIGHARCCIERINIGVKCARCEKDIACETLALLFAAISFVKVLVIIIVQLNFGDLTLTVKAIAPYGGNTTF